MPKRKSVWASWNYLADTRSESARPPEVSYWLNRLQNLPAKQNVFLTLNPATPPEEARRVAEFNYHHPLFDSAALRAQTELWRLQGHRNTWFCGSYFGYGFHEDALQSARRRRSARGCLPALEPSLPVGPDAVALAEPEEPLLAAQ